MNEIHDLLTAAVLRTPNAVCVVEGDRFLTFAEVDDRADRLARAFADHGVRPGDRVALLALSELEYLEIQVAAQRAKVILVPLNFRLAVQELATIQADCMPQLLIHGPECEEQARELALPLTWHLGSEGVGASYNVILERSEPLPRESLIGSTPNCILYTSGTTGRPKGAVISNACLMARVDCVGAEMGMQPGDVFVVTLPMFHVVAHFAYAFTRRGCTLVMLRKFDEEVAIAAMERNHATHVVFVPSMLPRLLERLEERPADLGALRLVLYGASAIAPDVLRRSIEVLGCEFIQGYGLTEGVFASVLRPVDHDPVRLPERLASAGTAGASYDVKVVDEVGDAVENGEVGEILVRGPAVMDGYWNAPEWTAEVIRDGWLHTGDLGYRSSDGYLYLTDRSKDVIVSGGENVYSREVEDALHEHPAVLEVAVIGIPNSQWGESVHAVVAPRAGTELDAEALIVHCRGRLAGYKVPKSVEIVDELPKNASGKILKRELRERYWQGAERSIG